MRSRPDRFRLDDYDAVEVWNGGLQFDRSDFDGLKARACDIANGHRPVLVGGSDNHRVNIAARRAHKPGAWAAGDLGFCR